MKNIRVRALVLSLAVVGAGFIPFVSEACVNYQAKTHYQHSYQQPCPQQPVVVYQPPATPCPPPQPVVVYQPPVVTPCPQPVQTQYQTQVQYQSQTQYQTQSQTQYQYQAQAQVQSQTQQQYNYNNTYNNYNVGSVYQYPQATSYVASPVIYQNYSVNFGDMNTMYQSQNQNSYSNSYANIPTVYPNTFAYGQMPSSVYGW